MLHDPRTQVVLAELRAKAADQAATSVQEWIANELRLARFDVARLLDEEGNLLPVRELDPDTRAAIQSIDLEEEQITVTKAGEDTVITTRTRVKKIRAHSKDGSQDRLARYLGAYEHANEQQNPITRLVELVPPERLALLETILRGCIGDAGHGSKAATGHRASGGGSRQYALGARARAP